MSLKAIALLGVLAHLAVAQSQPHVADYSFANTTECTEVTYYELSHGRYMAAPIQYVSGYGDILGAKRGYHPDCFASHNITNAIIGNATAESNATTEALDIKDVLLPSGQDKDKRNLEKRLSWLLGPITLFMKAIGFAGTIMSGLCQIFTAIPKYESTAWNKNNCIIGGVFVVSAVVFAAAIAGSGNAAVAWSASVQTYNAIYLSVAGGSSEAAISYLLSVFAKKRSDMDIPEMFRHIAEAHRNTGIAKNITLAGIALTQGVNLHHPSGYEYNVMDLMGADHLNPLTRNVTIGNHTVIANWWVRPHPHKANSSILVHRLPSSQWSSLANHTMHQQTKRQQTGWDEVPFDGPNNRVSQYGGLDSVDAGGSDPDLIFGMDFYDGPEVIGDQVGPEDGGDGEASQMDADISTYIIDNQSWENCMCFKNNGNWAGTGSMQYTWDQKYNGYSACYAADCDGA